MTTDTLQALADAAADAAFRAYGWNSGARLERVRIIPSPFSHLLQLSLSSDPDVRTVWVKAPRVTDDNAHLVNARIHTEFAVLSRLAGRYRGHPGLGVVRPLAVMDEPLALITEDAPGATLKRTLSNTGRFPPVLWNRNQLETLCRRSGEWLRIFHDETRCGAEATNWEGTIAYCERRLDLLLEQPESGINQDVADRIRAALADCIDAVDPAAESFAGRHNDFAGHNIVVTGDGGLSVLDFSMFDYDSVAFDYFNFVHDLEAFRFDPLYGRRTVERLVAAFMAGYGESFPSREPLRKIVYCRLSLSKLLTRCGRRRGNPVRRLFSGSLKRAYADWLHAFAGGRPC